MRSSPIGEIHVASRTGDVLHTSLPSRPAGGATDLPHAADLGPIRDDTTRVVEHPVTKRAADGAISKYVSVADADTPRFVQVGLQIADSSPVSPRFG